MDSWNEKILDEQIFFLRQPAFLSGEFDPIE